MVLIPAAPAFYVFLCFRFQGFPSFHQDFEFVLNFILFFGKFLELCHIRANIRLCHQAVDFRISVFQRFDPFLDPLYFICLFPLSGLLLFLFQPVQFSRRFFFRAAVSAIIKGGSAAMGRVALGKSGGNGSFFLLFFQIIVVVSKIIRQAAAG